MAADPGVVVDEAAAVNSEKPRKIEILKSRARLIAATRDFLVGRGYWEVETPILSRDVCVDAHLDPFVLDCLPGARSAGRVAAKREMQHERIASGFDRERFRYLQTSPEFAMKRLLAAGSGSIFQIAKVFRSDESGPLHNPEFTMLEWYRVGGDYRSLANEVQRLIETIFERACHGSCPGVFRDLTYRQAFQEFADLDPFLIDESGLRARAATCGFASDATDRDDLLNFLLVELVEPQLRKMPAVGLFDFPASQAALSKIDPQNPDVAQRFEIYLHGIEICNGYQELTDAVELRRRNNVQNLKRVALGKQPLPNESKLLEAMEAGFPESAGVALGLDRLLMIALGCESVEPVLSFDWHDA